MMDDTQGLECFWSDPAGHPQCPHGPMLLFGKYTDDKLEQFYACSACRDRKLCKFHLQHGEKLTKQQKTKWELNKKKLTKQYPHQKLYIRFNELMSKNPEARAYCHTCEKLFLTSEKDKHDNHQITDCLTDRQMSHPTEVLKPLNDPKKEAQYLFSKKSVEDIANMLIAVNAKQVLCIGTPRLHEYISEKLEHKISSLLMDFDGRFHNFFGPLSFCWYNLFNHHFFNEDAKSVFKDFITQNKGKDTYLVCDPPFGGRVEPISWTIKRISDLHKKWNNVENETDSLKIMFIFPYFMESIMKQKSNPPGISGGLKDLEMSDYKVDYDNHPLFVIEKNGKKQDSPVRIFTNITLGLLQLPESDGYKYCKRCQKWVCNENKHCKKCKACTSKSGKRYRHCNSCERCVKATWNHCDTCKRCALPTHKCGERPKTTGKCFKCNKFGHTEKDCDNANTTKNDMTEVKKGKKRKISTKGNVTKKKKLDGTGDSKGKEEKAFHETHNFKDGKKTDKKKSTNQLEKLSTKLGSKKKGKKSIVVLPAVKFKALKKLSMKLNKKAKLSKSSDKHKK